MLGLTRWRICSRVPVRSRGGGVWGAFGGVPALFGGEGVLAMDTVKRIDEEEEQENNRGNKKTTRKKATRKEAMRKNKKTTRGTKF